MSDPPHASPSGDLPPSALVQRIRERLRPYRKTLAGSITLLVFSVPFTNFHPLVWGIVADALLDGTLTARSLWGWIGIMVATYVLGTAASAWHTYLLERTGQAFVRDVRMDLFRKFGEQSLSYHRNHHTGELVTRITSDVDAMETSVLQGLSGLLEEVVTFVVVAGMVLWISPPVGLASILPLAFAFLFIRIYNRKVKHLYDGVRQRLGHIGAFVQDRLAGIQVTQSFVREAAEQADFDGRAAAFHDASIRASRLRNTYFPVVALFGFVNNAIMLGAGGWLILNGSEWFTIGALIAYRGFWWRLQSPIRTIAQTSDILQRARAAALRVVQLLDAPVVVRDPEVSAPWSRQRGGIEFREVAFAYVPGKPVLRGTSFRIEPGEFVAIAGGSGSGKSTLLTLIPRFHDVTEGSVRVDGLDVRTLGLATLRAPIGFVGQDNYLFDGTIRENLRYGRPDASEGEIEAAARSANAHGFILDLPDGYETRVGQNGVKLSGGQRQRLSLARAFLIDPVILLLDEPTAAVEPESEALIHEAILRRTHSGRGTTVLVTHRVDLLRLAPRILFLEGGEVAGDGPHERLVSTCPDYATSYQRWEVETEKPLLVP